VKPSEQMQAIKQDINPITEKVQETTKIVEKPVKVIT